MKEGATKHENVSACLASFWLSKHILYFSSTHNFITSWAKKWWSGIVINDIVR